MLTLDEKDRQILDFCKQPKSSREILELAGVSYQTKNFKRYISRLIVEITIINVLVKFFCFCSQKSNTFVS